MNSSSSRYSRALQVRISFAATCAALLGPSSVEAQVGFPPQHSPYQDQKIGQTLTLSGGFLRTGRDPASVMPEAAPMFGLRYDIGIGGPSALYVRYSGSPSQRQLLIPTRPAETRVDGTPSVTTHIMDLGLDIYLTGRKSWHNIMPAVTGGIGLVSDFEDADAGGYRFGTKFAVTYGAAMRIVPGGRLSYRVDLTNFYWQYQYPDSYFIPGPDQTSVLSDTRKRNAWKGNWGLTVGASWALFP